MNPDFALHWSKILPPLEQNFAPVKSKILLLAISVESTDLLMALKSPKMVGFQNLEISCNSLDEYYRIEKDHFFDPVHLIVGPHSLFSVFFSTLLNDAYVQVRY